MTIPSDLHYATTHEWVRRDPSNTELVTIGISDHAQAELTDIVYVELPQVEAIVSAKGPAAVVESVKAASDIYAPVSGSVVEVNERLLSEPGLINTDPFGEGWIFKIRCSALEELNTLLTAEAYELSLKQ